jgi:trigger factor
MSQTATQSRPNVVKVEDAGPSCKKLSIQIPAETVSEKLRSSIETLTDEAALPGFRKGHVPRWLVEKKFGPTLRKEARGELVSAAFQKAVEEHKLKVVGQPTAPELDKLEVKDGQAFSFELEVEVLPEFDLPVLEGVAIKKPMLEIKDEHVAEELGKIAVNEGTLESRDVAEAGDYITGHAIMTSKDGTEFYNLKGAVVQSPMADKNGKGMILGIMVDDFSKQLGKPKAGDTVTIKAKGPDGHEIEGVRNADLTITFTIDRVDRILPAKIEDLVAAFGLESEDRLKELLRTRMTQRVQIQQQNAMHQQAATHLLDNTKMELPKRMTSQQAVRTLERRRLELMYRGVEAHKIEEHMAELRAASSAAAARDLKLFFILHKAAETLKIGVTEAEVNNRIVQIAVQRNMRPEQLRQELIRTNQVSGIFQQILDHKTLDAIVAKANVTEISADEYNKTLKAEVDKS